MIKVSGLIRHYAQAQAILFYPRTYVAKVQPTEHRLSTDVVEKLSTQDISNLQKQKQLLAAIVPPAQMCGSGGIDSYYFSVPSKSVPRLLWTPYLSLLLNILKWEGQVDHS